jgi:ATP-dependent DNA ligase
LAAKTYAQRRQALEQLATDRELVMPTRRLPANGFEAWKEVLRGNYEGMVGKDPASAYTAGRTLSWLKVKQRGYRQEARGFDHR